MASQNLALGGQVRTPATPVGLTRIFPLLWDILKSMAHFHETKSENQMSNICFPIAQIQPQKNKGQTSQACGLEVRR